MERARRTTVEALHPRCARCCRPSPRRRCSLLRPPPWPRLLRSLPLPGMSPLTGKREVWRRNRARRRRLCAAGGCASEVRKGRKRNDFDMCARVCVLFCVWSCCCCCYIMSDSQLSCCHRLRPLSLLTLQRKEKGRKKTLERRTRVHLKAPGRLCRRPRTQTIPSLSRFHRLLL